MQRTIIATCLLAFASAAAQGQTPGGSPAFEVASVKPNTAKPGTETGGIRLDPEMLPATRVTLASLVRWAYGLKSYQLPDAPRLPGDSYDIAAKSPRPAGKDQMMLMMQSLLADRFKLRVHRETREVPVFELLAMKSVPKLTEVEASDNQQAIISMFRNGPSMWMRLTASKAPMSQVTDVLTAVLMATERPVLDRTHLQGSYDFKLEWVPEGSDDTTGPSLYTAIQEQLGLKLESSKAQVEVLVIDHAEKTPTEN